MIKLWKFNYNFKCKSCNLRCCGAKQSDAEYEQATEWSLEMQLGPIGAISPPARYRMEPRKFTILRLPDDDEMQRYQYKIHYLLLNKFAFEYLRG